MEQKDIWCRDRIGNIYTFIDFSNLVRAFHGSPAPGVLIGGRMVETAMREIPQSILYDAICETSSCLPDAIQLLTPCTCGNGWLKILPIGRFAIALYDKTDGKGVRVWIDGSRLARWPDIHAWFYKTQPKQQQDRERLLNAIQSAGSALFSVRTVQIDSSWLIKTNRGTIIDCPRCGEAYPQQDGNLCRGCQGQTPYMDR